MSEREEAEIKLHPEGGMPAYCTICNVKMDNIKINYRKTFSRMRKYFLAEGMIWQ
ncbi:MAG: hypothetical protein ACE5KE_14145 [Methanosarcinales archaeon]